MIILPTKIQKTAGHYLTFFGDSGLSMSDANSVGGKAGDIAETVSRLLAQTGSYIKTTTLDRRNVTLVHPKKISNLAEVAKRDGELYGLKAYLMEAIKAKNALIDYLKNAPVEDFAEADEKFQRFDTEEDVHPQREAVTEETVLQTWNLEERAEYYLLEARVAHLGKKVHPNGVIDRLAQESFEGIRYEREELNSGLGDTKTHVAEVRSVYTPDEAQRVFYELHDTRRELERKLNYFKARLQNQLNARAVEAEKDYQKKFNEYTEMQKAKRALDEDLRSTLTARRLMLVREAADLKILMPDALRGIYDFVVNFSGRLV